MEPEVYLAAIEHESRSLAHALETDRAAIVRACPGWSVADLVVHLGTVQRWATEMVRSGARERVGDREGRFGTAVDSDTLGAWFLEGADALVRELGNAPIDRPVWSWVNGSTVAFWQRRQAHETAVHRWDGEFAVGEPAPIDASLASDGIDEVLSVFAAARSRERSTLMGSGESFHFHCTDVPGEWFVRFDGSTMEVRSAHEKADVAARGNASDVLLFLWGRRPAADLDVVGDAPLLDRWTEFIPPT